MRAHITIQLTEDLQLRSPDDLVTITVPLSGTAVLGLDMSGPANDMLMTMSDLLIAQLSALLSYAKLDLDTAHDNATAKFDAEHANAKPVPAPATDPTTAAEAVHGPV